MGRRAIPHAHRCALGVPPDRWLAENFDAIKPEALTGQWGGMFKLTVGDYRLLYTFDKTAQNIIVHFVKHRREVCKMR